MYDTPENIWIRTIVFEVLFFDYYVIRSDFSGPICAYTNNGYPSQLSLKIVRHVTGSIPCVSESHRTKSNCRNFDSTWDSVLFVFRIVSRFTRSMAYLSMSTEKR